MNSDGVWVDRDLARRAIRHETENNPDLFRGGFGQGFQKHVFDAAIGLTRPGHRFNVNAFRGFGRTVAAYPRLRHEKIYTVESRLVGGSRKNTFVEVSFRSTSTRPNHEIVFSDCYLHVRKERMIIARRQFPVSMALHSVERYIQRGERVNLAGRTVEGVLADVSQKAGLFILLAHVAGAWNKTRFAVPFREGLMLCETMAAKPPLTQKFEVEDYVGNDALNGLMAPHRLLWVAEGAGPGQVLAKTFIGLSEMKFGQKRLHEMIGKVYAQAGPAIDLLGELAGRWYPAHDPVLEAQLKDALPILDAAVITIGRQLERDTFMSYAFTKEESFSASSVSLPSKAVLAEVVATDRHGRIMSEMGMVGHRGASVCHIGPLGTMVEPMAWFRPLNEKKPCFQEALPLTTFAPSYGM